ncbi:hypothetical protein [Halalkalicoccus tibetensis]|uniref:SWIM-type domain-containing protein n=1 Tax=Halalkalicoccus tibetensis TaxID=175632 RepID=A0ABD5V6E0_9EURY
MCATTPHGKTTTDHEPTDLDARDVRALTDCMTVLGDQGRVRGVPGLYEVVSASGSTYLVDVDQGVCECPDHEHRGAHCKHLRRVEVATGARTIPAWIADDELDDDLGAFVRSGPRFEPGHVVAEPDASTAGHAVATDGGVVVEDVGSNEPEPASEPEITRHVEPPEQGGATYYRCECGREAMREQDLRSDAHREECSARGGL